MVAVRSWAAVLGPREQRASGIRSICRLAQDGRNDRRSSAVAIRCRLEVRQRVHRRNRSSAGGLVRGRRDGEIGFFNRRFGSAWLIVWRRSRTCIRLFWDVTEATKNGEILESSG